ncbi:hypothetical protein [Ureibacillus sp. FSL K6-0165]|jgi:hypothetical protein|uniref:hypothetical protein n=1 Tax=Ureibacillus sp. FSL K6-0165 TaxID=2954606 RepID=UPI0030F7DA66
MSRTDESLRPLKSRITIFDEPIICSFCTYDVFIPYEVYVNVEEPGIGVYHVRYSAICQHCGQAKIFSDPSHFDEKTKNYIWALNQYLLSERKYKIKIIFYIGKKREDKLQIFLDMLLESQFEIDSILREKTEVSVRAKITTMNELQWIRDTIMNSAGKLFISIKSLSIK